MKTKLLQTKCILEEKDLLAALCNTTAFLYEIVDNINWLGFYFLKNNELVLGPFQGKIACTHLSLNKGVCAFAVKQKQLINVKDVHTFDGHIACDSNSRSELVVPLVIKNKIIGVLDIDSPMINRFSRDDELFFENVGKLISSRMQYDI